MPRRATASKRSTGRIVAPPIPPSMKADSLFDLWCSLQTANHKKTQHVLLSENPGTQKNAVPIIVQRTQNHYLSPQTASESMQYLGYKKSSKLKKLLYPIDKKTRSGELGEILATEFVNAKLHFQVPILKLRWKDGRNLAMRGDDFIAVKVSGKKLSFIKGESKSRSRMGSKTLGEAVTALRRNRGRPSSHSLAFIAYRLHDDGQPELANMILNYLAKGETGATVHHLVFTLSENNPQSLLIAFHSKSSRWVAFVNLVVSKHQKLIKQIYKALHGQA